ncbi:MULTISPECIES: outer membrane protein assembly factor BamE domain-containing protein [Campylobacter]|uniref:outer membrane protein assembly factor BamE domain-containing protein n=1 Tax=Campylobacter TaxID=194 RepID=UPI001ECC8B5C|nr:outer membrane protein assembly factor BamE [Campylobacter sp. W0014]MBZ7953865.1 outer membrane protein assembly factor BamE [Campylobacter sp. W0018]
MKYLLYIVLAFILSACYQKGLEVNQDKLNSIVIGKSTQEDVEKIIGYPVRKTSLGNKEVWYYDFTRISSLPGFDKDESTVFEFNKKGIVVKKYKTTGSGNSNPLLGG